MAEIKLKDITKRYPDGFEAVKDFNLEIADGEFVILVGPSGCGKSTALRMIAGLEDITEGELLIGDEVVNQRAPKDRDIAMVFQNYALYPHMTVRENMGFALKLAKTPQEEIDSKVDDAAKVLDLEQHLDRKPANLSGGQRQRVAMGRAIVRDPSAFLMDEPLSNLDAKLRVQMRAEVSRLQQRLGTTTVYVTHDQTEAMTLGDRVAVMRAGVLQQVDKPERAVQQAGQPVRRRLHRLARDELLPGHGRGRPPASCRSPRCRCPRSCVRAPGPRVADLIAGVRPEQFEDAELETGASGGTEFEAAVELVESLGAEVYVHFGIGSGGAQSEELAELAADSGAADVPSAGEGASPWRAWSRGRRHGRESATGSGCTRSPSTSSMPAPGATSAIGRGRRPLPPDGDTAADSLRSARRAGDQPSLHSCVRTVVALGADAQVRVGLGARSELPASRSVSTTRHVLGVEPFARGPLAVEQVAALQRRAICPCLDGLGQAPIGPRVAQLDPRASPAGQRHALAEHALVALARQVGEHQLARCARRA